jgi:hypothetical protein
MEIAQLASDHRVHEESYREACRDNEKENKAEFCAYTPEELTSKAIISAAVDDGLDYQHEIPAPTIVNSHPDKQIERIPSAAEEEIAGDGKTVGSGHQQS